MATLASLSSARLPFGAVDNGRLMHLQNTKNSQNALYNPTSTSLKRPAIPVNFDEEDYENIDPASLEASGKRMKTLDGYVPSKINMSMTKKTHFILTKALPSPDDVSNTVKSSSCIKSFRKTRVPVSRISKTTSLGGVVHANHAASLTFSKAQSSLTTNHSESPATISSRPSQSKRGGLLNRKRNPSPFTRINPAFKPLQHASSLSIDSALSGTLSSYKASTSRDSADVPASETPTLDQKAKPKTWFFDIHEDTQEETLHNIMEFYTCTLDISDDETRRAEREDRGKENIPPPEAEVFSEMATHNASGLIAEPSAAAAAPPTKPRRNPARQAKRIAIRKAAKRAPLADLPPADFADEEIEVGEIKLQLIEKTVASTLKEVMSSDDLPMPTMTEEGDKDIQIWESASAADEAERAEREEEGVALKILTESTGGASML